MARKILCNQVGTIRIKSLLQITRTRRNNDNRDESDIIPQEKNSCSLLHERQINDMENDNITNGDMTDRQKAFH